MPDFASAQRYQAKPLTGGLDTNLPQTSLPPSSSPDLQNVMLNDHSVDKRSGFTPLIREHPNLNCIENFGHHAVARDGVLTADPNTNFATVPGHMVAGHRQVYATLDDLTIDFVCRVDDLTDEMGSNVDANSPYTVNVRPILSKGPLHRTVDTAAVFGGLISWSTANPWGDQANEGCPFFIYLFNNAGTWEWRLSFHTFNVNWILQTAVASTPVEVGGQYHVIVNISGSTNSATIRVGRMRRNEPTVYADGTANFPGETYTEGNRCPIQVFDCPQDIIEATNVGTPAVRPGLNLGGAADGGYFYGTLRFEGAIEDLVIFNTARLTTGGIASMDRDGGKWDLSAETDVINAWTMTDEGEQYVQEVTGRGNHLYFAPSGPVFDGISGAPRAGASWWFNGNTSHALVDLEEGQTTPFNPSWNEYTSQGAQVGAFMREAARQGLQHGIEVSFWVDSIEPQFEQVLMEVRGVLRLAIGIDGQLRGYCRDASAAVVNPVGGSQYQGTVTSNTTLQPGQRYTVALMRRDGGTTLSLSVNGVVDATAVVVASAAAGLANAGGITIGMGSFETLQEPTAANADPNTVNTDHRSGFCGRIEQVRIICSDENQAPVYKDADISELEFEQEQLAINAASVGWFGQSALDPMANRANGMAISATDVQRTRFIRYLQVAQTGVRYDTDNTPAEAGNGEGGHNDLDKVRIHTWFVLAQWNFNLDDRDNNYGGAHIAGLETIITGAGALQANSFKSVHVQASAVQDDMAALGPIFKRCVEMDWHTLLDNPVPANEYTGLRPYTFRSPRELSVRWARGILTPLTETNPITLVADWQHQESGERFLNAACGRQIYWVKPIWKRGSPFKSEIDVDALFFGGQAGDHIVAQGTNSEQETTGNGSRTTVVWEAWIHPFRVDGTRVLAYKGQTSAPPVFVNYCIAMQDGALELTGTADGGTRAWRFREGFYQNDDILRTQSIKVNAWNHVHVTLKNAGPEVRVNGDLVPLVDSSADSAPATTDGFTVGVADAGNYSLFIGGIAEGRNVITYNATPGAFTETYQSFFGLITEVRQRNAEDLARWPAGESGIPPTTRYTSDANTWYLFHFNEGTGWGFDNAAVPAAGDDAKAEIRELVLIGSGLAESTGHRYDSVVFRDELFITNGESRPQRIRFTRFSDSLGPFRVEQVGMIQPFAHAVTLTESQAVVNTPLTDGIYQVAMAFLHEDGRESEAVLLGSITLSGPTTAEAIRVTNVPRSHDPQVRGKRFWVSANGGGPPITNLILPDDNETVEIELDPTLSLGLGLPIAGEKVPGPRARHIAVGQFSLILADLLDEPAGQNAFIVSQAREPTYFNVDNTIVIDSEDGKPVIAVRGLFGRTFISKRDSVWQFSLGGLGILDEIGLGLRLVNKSIGVGGGDSVYDNVIYGAGDKGIHRFDSSNIQYASEALEGDWNSVVDRSDAGLVQMFGAYYWPDSQYWLSVRTKGESYNERIYVLHTSVAQGQSWTRLLVPRHTYLTSRLRGDNQDPQLLLGGLSGQILRLNDEGAGVFIDGTDGSINDNGAVTLEGTATAGSTTTLTMAGANFDTTGPGLRAVEVALTFADGSTETRVIESNTATVLTWRTATSQPVVGGATPTTFVIGGYLAYWTSGWIDPQPYGLGIRALKVDMDYLPAAGVTMDVQTRTAVGVGSVDRAWDSAAAIEVGTQLLTTGWQPEPLVIHEENRGRYFRARFSTDGINSPFSLVGWGFRWAPSGLRQAQP
jgi:hypothetical protein